ncbi:hypothetical protein JCM3775_003731 [Rhodotorula graminis]|uniref:Uncharacterized protein n=1 Tax=Rhodotorula graminis (strain WP1) TaxID=578459 RepID=A0A0P9GXH9_RHOGW|nr:uncharacterized protein RHOBADRAFT_55975 [Rhodotorula graminis WP1]KPV72136.1 hypothetical protein RHOBADRAFT_55975 [Rhodotorula graminis WP1]
MDQQTASIEHAAAPAPPRALDASRPPLLPRLIDDVLLAILDELGQPDYTADGYKLRQKTLRSVCLVSRRLYTLARPVLWRQVVVNEDEQVKQLRQSGAVLGAHTKVYQVGRRYSVCDREAGVSVGAARLPNVEDLTVAGEHEQDLPLWWLRGYDNLRRLELVDLDAISISGGMPTLPRLEELIISRCAVSPDYAYQWLTSAWLPRLKILAVRAPRFELASALSPSLTEQLEVVLVDSVFLDDRWRFSRRFSSKPAVIVSNPSPLKALPRVGMCGSEPFFGSTDATVHQRVLDTIKAGVVEEPHADPDAATVLLLPLQVIDAAVEASVRPLGLVKNVEAWQELEELCRQRGRRVLWYDEQEFERSHEIVPREFKRYLRELKATSTVEASPSSSSR